MSEIVATINTRQIDRLFRRLEKNTNASSRRVLFNAIAQDMQAAVQKNFATEGRRVFPGGWRQLAASTRRRKAKTGKSKILQNSAQLKNSINARGTSTYAVVGTNKKYGRIHQMGGTINHPGGTPYIPFSSGGNSLGVRFMRKDGNYPPGTGFTKPHQIKIPKRPFLAFNASDIDLIEKRIGEVMVK